MEATRTPRLAPYLVVANARELVKFVETALGGTLSFEMEGIGGRLEHAELRIADSLLMVADAPPGRPPFPAMLHLYVSDALAAYRRAIAAGAASVREPAMAPDGHLRGGVRDPWGNEWWFSTPRGGL